MERDLEPGQLWELTGSVATNKVLSISDNEILVEWKRNIYSSDKGPVVFLILSVWNYSLCFVEHELYADRIPCELSNVAGQCKIVVLYGEKILAVSYSDWHFRAVGSRPEFRLKSSENSANAKE